MLFIQKTVQVCEWETRYINKWTRLVSNSVISDDFDF